jgi:uncharacterized protein (DUF736 family)
MAKLNVFQTDNYGDWTGRVKTPAGKQFLRISRVGQPGKQQPDYVVMKGKAEVGQGWSMTSNADGEFLDIWMDDRLWGVPKSAILKMCVCGCGGNLIMTS